MSNIKSNSNIDRTRLIGNGKRPKGPDVRPGGELGGPVITQIPAPPQMMGEPSQFFISSLPGIAASFDQFRRQFYGRSSLPTQRIFIPNIE